MINVSELMFDPDFVQTVKLKTVSFTTVDFEPVRDVTVNNIAACIQVADMEILNTAAIDWSREYIMAHSHMPMDFGQYIEYKGRDYKIIRSNNYYDYGYSEVVAEETKQPLLLPVIPDNVVTHLGEVVTHNGEPVTYSMSENVLTYMGSIITYNGEPVTYTP